MLFIMTSTQAKSPKQATEDTDHYVNADKLESLSFKQGGITILIHKLLKLVDQFTHFGSNI